MLMSLRLLLVGNYGPDQQKSMAAFVTMMEHCMAERNASVEVFFPGRYLLPKGTKPRGFWKWVGYIDKFIISSLLLKRKAKEFDIVHICDHSNSMYTFFVKGKPSIVTCHDVLAIEAARDMIPGWDVGFTGRIFQRLIFRGLNGADVVVCDSEYTKSHLQKLGWAGRHIAVAPITLNDNFHPSERHSVERTLGQMGMNVNDKYFIHVGSDLSRKNRLFVIKVFNILRKLHTKDNFKLLFVGPPMSEEMHNYIKEHRLDNFVSAMQDVPHDMLKNLYSGATGLIFPSLYEGFGWPIIEAQACGCPVFTSNRQPMLEVGGDGAIYIDPIDENAAATQISEALGDLVSLQKRGFANCEQFSMEKMVAIYLAAYNSAMEKS
jgi:glycosyltransferase involved in cell wall biosynthesis